MAGPSGVTPKLSLPYPTPADDVNVPRDVQALATAVDSLGVVPVGAIMMWALPAAPTGWLFCQGQSVSAATYPALAALFGSSGGNVTLPNFKDRFMVGAGGTYALNDSGGEATHVLTPSEGPVKNHTHSFTTGNENQSLAHSHGGYVGPSYQVIATAGGGEKALANILTRSDCATTQFPTLDSNDMPVTVVTGGPSPHTHSGSTGNPTNANGAAHENRPPYLAINYIIRAG